MGFYVINLFLFIFCLICTRRKSKYMWTIAFTWLFLLGALRGEGVGADYGSYEIYFNFFGKNSWQSSLAWGIEPGYVLLCKIVYLFGGTYQVLLAVCSFISLLGIVSFIKRFSNQPILSMWLYITFLFYQSTYTRLRAAIAISIILFSVQYVMDRKPVKFLICIVLAVCFHTTALCSIVLYFIYNIKVNGKTILVTILLTTGVLVFGNSILSGIFTIFDQYDSKYNNSDIVAGDGLNMLFVIFAIFIFICFGSYRIENARNYRNIDKTKSMRVFLLFPVTSIWLMCQAMALNFNLFSRVGDYFGVMTILLLPNIIEYLFVQNSKKIAIVIICILSLMYYIYLLSLGGSGTVPYIFCN